MNHRLLNRQLKSHGLESDRLPDNLERWKLFLERIERAYTDSDSERYLMERSMQISSQEMQERWKTIELERTRSMQSEKMAALGIMSAGIAHEINNPLAVVMTIAGQLQEVLLEEPLDKSLIIERLKKIEITTGRIAKIIKGLRTVSRESKHDPFEEISIHTLLGDTLALCEPSFKQVGIEILVDEINPSILIHCRPSQIAQVFLNILNNARDAISTLEKKWVKVSVKEAGNFLKISIADCGKGISKEIQEKIFYPFFTTKEPGKGTGLGLSLSKEIIEAHGGELTFDSAEPNTCFVISLPTRQVKK